MRGEIGRPGRCSHTSTSRRGSRRGIPCERCGASGSRPSNFGAVRGVWAAFHSAERLLRATLTKVLLLQKEKALLAPLSGAHQTPKKAQKPPAGDDVGPLIAARPAKARICNSGEITEAALVEAHRADEVKDIRDRAVGMQHALAKTGPNFRTINLSSASRRRSRKPIFSVELKHAFSRHSALASLKKSARKPTRKK